ncbi:MAG: thioredoxin-disulfide reductase [candidate division KSB1 bacterium]|nr:thioredoxin-disulfide reductase [candidate division KSB1 bacterium]
MHNVVIIGAGPAGLTAAIYAARALLQPLVITGSLPGGQITLTNEMENYPGFPEGIGGFELYQAMEKQARRFGTELVHEVATKVDFSKHPFTIVTDKTTYQARTVIIATGSSPRKLAVPGEKELTGRGVSYCATCDGFFFKEQQVAVIGGGNSALDEAIFLTRFASKVTIIHRRDRLRADLILQERARKNEKIDFIWDSVVTEIMGEKQVEQIRLKNLKTGQESLFPVDGVFIFIGHLPNTEIFQGQIDMDDRGYILTDRRQRTNVDGVYAAGDVQDPLYRQSVTAAGSGCIAALEAEKFIAELEGQSYPGK